MLLTRAKQISRLQLLRTPEFVQSFEKRPIKMSGAHRGPSSESRQGTNPRVVCAESAAPLSYQDFVDAKRSERRIAVGLGASNEVAWRVSGAQIDA